jgi:hypothetical protein
VKHNKTFNLQSVKKYVPNPYELSLLERIETCQSQISNSNSIDYQMAIRFYTAALKAHQEGDNKDSIRLMVEGHIREGTADIYRITKLKELKIIVP